MSDAQEAAGLTLAAVLDRSRAMAMCRKLGKEIELALKKTTDGIAAFHELISKMVAAEARSAVLMCPLISLCSPGRPVLGSACSSAGHAVAMVQ